MENPTIERILHRCEEAMNQAKKRIIDPILGMGEDRGGIQRFGGPLCMDWGSLIAMRGIHQIVGHTPGKEIRKRLTANSQNYCLDVRNASVAGILANGQLTLLKR